jgi:hypothetical protein
MLFLLIIGLALLPESLSFHSTRLVTSRASIQLYAKKNKRNRTVNDEISQLTRTSTSMEENDERTPLVNDEDSTPAIDGNIKAKLKAEIASSYNLYYSCTIIRLL